MNDNIRNFFEDHILPLHEKVKTGEITYLNQSFRTSEESYFSDPLYPQYQYLSTIAIEDEEDLRQYLETFWKDQPELLGLIPDLLKIAMDLKEENKEQSAELSPFLYVMF